MSIGMVVSAPVDVAVAKLEVTPERKIPYIFPLLTDAIDGTESDIDEPPEVPQAFVVVLRRVPLPENLRIE